MKTISSDLREHLDQEVTALCTCWTITRSDGVILRFTDADQDVVQGGDTYTSIGAYQRTAIENTSTLSVDNLEIVGASNDLSLPDTELRTGLFDNAEVTIFMTPWLSSVPGRLKLRRGFFGEVQTLPNGTYQVELRGIMQRLAYNYTDIFSATCLYDLGQPECGILIKGADMDAGTTYAVNAGARIAQSTYKRGKAYEIGWGDPDFEISGAAGSISESVYWYNRGANDIDTNLTSAYAGTYSAKGGAGAGTLTQDVDLAATTGLPLADLDGETCYLTARAFRRDAGDTGQYRIQFLDNDGIELGYGQQLDLNSDSFTPAQIDFTGDFTVELWIKLEASADINQSIFGHGSIGAGTGTRFSFETGVLSLRIDDNVLTGSNQFIVQSSESPTVGEWRHVAVTRTGSDVYLYENFREVDSGSYAGTISLSVWGNADDSSGFVGKWDELRVWDVARTKTELSLSAHQPISAGSPNLIRYYSFNDTTGADLTGTDAFVFGAGNLQTGTGSPVSVPVADALSLGSATYASGYADVGTTWLELEVTDHLIPANTRIMRLNFDVTGPDSWIDNLTGHIINTNEYGNVIGYMTDNIVWRCTGAGTTDVDQASGNVGDTLNIGSATLVGEDAYLRGARVLSVTGNNKFVIDVSDSRAVDAWFTEGGALFETGDNAGVGMEIKNWDATTREIELFLSMPNPVKAGDYLSVYPGCDKSRISCAAIFRNIANMFATPDVPGQDELLRYPDAK